MVAGISDFVLSKYGIDVVSMLSFNGSSSLDFSASIVKLLTVTGLSDIIGGCGVRTGGLITCGTWAADAYKMK